MSSQRFDIYRLIHKGLRSYLTDTLLAIGRMDPSADGELREGVQQLRGLLVFCQSHLEHENTFIHSAMEQVRPGCTQAMNDHHRHHEEMIGELRQQAEQLESAQLAGREALAADLYRALAVFVADNLSHMYEEETVNNRILWDGYSDDEIRAIENRIIASQSPEENAETTRWMLSAMNHRERHRFLSEIRQAAPDFVFAGTLAIARQQLAGGDWRRLELALAS